MYDRGYTKDEISGWRYRELKAILMQYDERAQKIRAAIYLPTAIANGTYKGKGTVSDPTAKAAEKIARLKEINDKIDSIVHKVEQGRIFRRCLGYKEAVAAGYKGCKDKYYANKRLFFSLMDQAFS